MNLAGRIRSFESKDAGESRAMMLDGAGRSRSPWEDGLTVFVVVLILAMAGQVLVFGRFDLFGSQIVAFVAALTVSLPYAAVATRRRVIPQDDGARSDVL